MANGRPSPKEQAETRRVGQHQGQVGKLPPEFEEVFQRPGSPPDVGIRVPDWMKKIGDMLSGKKKAEAAPAPAPTPPQSFTGAQVDSILNRNRSAGR